MKSSKKAKENRLAFMRELYESCIVNDGKVDTQLLIKKHRINPGFLTNMKKLGIVDYTRGSGVVVWKTDEPVMATVEQVYDKERKAFTNKSTTILASFTALQLKEELLRRGYEVKITEIIKREI